MEPRLNDCAVINIKPLIQGNKRFFSLEFENAFIAESAEPGQIVHVKCGENLLRRPFGVNGVNVKAGTFRVCFEVRGKGTRWMSGLKAGDVVSVMGPYGKPFETLKYSEKKVLLVGGGIGIYPLLFAADRLNLNGAEVRAALGFQTASLVHMESEFKTKCARVEIATDDGSYGYGGFVTDMAAGMADETRFDAVFACGPFIMMKKTHEIASARNIPCFVSLEERMGCGVGACLACVCDTVNGKKRVCVDGPVFASYEIRW